MDSIYPGIEIFGVYDRGVPNEERIVLRVTKPMDLGGFFLLLGHTQPDVNDIWPFIDNFIWLGDRRLDMPGWVFIYTGKGKPGVSVETNTGQPIQTIYWNKDNIALSNPNVSPALISFGSVDIGNKPNKQLTNTNKIPPPPL